MRKYTYRFSRYGEMRDHIKPKEEQEQEIKRKPIYKLRVVDEIIYK